MQLVDAILSDVAYRLFDVAPSPCRVESTDEALAHGGKTAGREKIAAVLRQIRKDFEYILYRPFKLNADGETVRHQVEFMYRHLQSGEVLAGRFRMVMQVKDGLIVRADEYHDRAKVEAFLRLVAKREQEGEG